MEGWIKLHRKIIDKAFYSKDSEKVHLWIHLLLKANHNDYEEMLGGKPIVCKSGQFTTGRKQLASETGINESKIERLLTYFEKIEQQIEQQKTSTNRLISILKWGEYQENEQRNEQRVNNKRTTGEQRVNTLQEEKEIKNKKNIYIVNHEATNLNEWAKHYFLEKYIGESSAKIFDELMRIDGYTPEQIKNAIKWARGDGFWTGNFLSPAKLRNKDKNGVKYIDIFLAKIIQNGTIKSTNAKGGCTYEQLAEVLRDEFGHLPK